MRRSIVAKLQFRRKEGFCSYGCNCNMQNGRAASFFVDVSDFQRMREAIAIMDDVRAAEEEIERGETFSPRNCARASMPNAKRPQPRGDNRGNTVDATG